MRKMLPLFCMMLTMTFTVTIVTASIAQEKATKEECQAKVKEAAQLIKEIGLKPALEKISDPDGPFIWKDTYVFVSGLDGVMLAHPNAKLVGKNLMAIKDTQGKMFFAEFIEVAKNKDEGWVSYYWPKPGEKEASPKVTYVYRVPGEDVVLLAGIYE